LAVGGTADSNGTSGGGGAVPSPSTATDVGVEASCSVTPVAASAFH